VALADLMRLSSSRERVKIGISEERINAQMTNIRNQIAF
jgi:hypothetical protein